MLAQSNVVVQVSYNSIQYSLWWSTHLFPYLPEQLQESCCWCCRSFFIIFILNFFRNGTQGTLQCVPTQKVLPSAKIKLGNCSCECVGKSLKQVYYSIKRYFLSVNCSDKCQVWLFLSCHLSSQTGDARRVGEKKDPKAELLSSSLPRWTGCFRCNVI